MKNLSKNNIKIDEISIDVVERELEFVGLKDNRGDRGLTGGIVQQGIIRVVTSTGIEGNSIIGQHRGNSTDKIKEIIKTFKPILINSKERDWVVISPIERSSLIARSKILSRSGNSILIRATFYFGKSSIL